LDLAAQVALRDWLKSARNDALPSAERNALRSTVASVLCGQAVLAPELAGWLCETWEDPAENAVWHDYGVQFMGVLLARKDVVEERDRIRAALQKAARSREGAIAGTALIALRNVPADIGFAPDDLGRCAIEICRDADRPASVKATALQIAVETRHPDALALARVEARRAPAPLRLSALAALGALGDEDDARWLKTQTTSSDIRVRAAATAALKHWKTRKGTP
jgi:hypothetical protein